MALSISNRGMTRQASPMARMATNPGINVRTNPGAGLSSGTDNRLRKMTGTPQLQMNPGQTISGQNPMSNQFQYIPQEYSKDVEGSFDTQLSQNAKDAQAAQAANENSANALQRRNASNAAIGGYSVGGGGFLAGQTNALLTGQANATETARLFSKNATDIEARRADYRAGIDRNNTDMANKYAYDDWVYNRGRQDTLADRKEEADEAAFANDIKNSVARWTQLFDSNTSKNIDGGGTRDEQFINLIGQLQSAKTPQEKAAAEAALQAYYAQAQGSDRNSNTDDGSYFDQFDAFGNRK